MSKTDAFALSNSGLNPFLFAEVGTENNGSTLTMLSVLARLGQDPWAEAARWSKRPSAAIIELVAASLEKMPLRPDDSRDIRVTAERLSRLLPGQSQGDQPVAKMAAGPVATVTIGRKPLLVLLCCVVAAGMIVNMLLSGGPGASTHLVPAETAAPPAAHSASP